MAEIGTYVCLTGVCTALWKSDEYLGGTGPLAVWPRKTKLLSRCLSCTGFFIKQLVASISSWQSSDFFFSCFYGILQSGFRVNYSVTFISAGENAHGFSPNNIHYFEGNYRAVGNSAMWRGFDR